MSVIKLVVHAQISIAKFLRETEGASGIEYAIIAAMVAVVIISFSTDITSGIKTIFTAIKNGVTTSATSTGA